MRPKLQAAAYFALTGFIVVIACLIVPRVMGLQNTKFWIVVLFLFSGIVLQTLLSNRFSPQWFDDVISWGGFLACFVLGLTIMFLLTE